MALRADGLKRNLEIWHLIIGLLSAIAISSYSAGIMVSTINNRLDAQNEKLQELREVKPRLEKMERNIVRIADKVNARIEDPN